MPGQRFTAVEMIEKLVSFDTTSRDSNLPLIEFVEQYLKGHGVASTRIPDETGRKANLYATIGPRERLLVTLATHVDNVGRSLNAAVGHYNAAVGSLESRVLVSARRFTDLAVTEADLPRPRPVVALARRAAPEESAEPPSVAL